MPRRVHIVTFGCQMNKLDSELVASALLAAGHEVVARPEEADAVLLNTCSVRDQAENRALSAVGVLKLRKEREPGFLIGVLGCMAQRRGKELVRRYPAIDLVVGTRLFPRIAELLEAAAQSPVAAVEENPREPLPARRPAAGPQAFVAAMRGCGNFCAYCIVPFVRGPEESRPLAEIVEEVRALVAGGAREVTLLGQSIDRWGQDLAPRRMLEELLAAVDGVPGLLRLRFITAHPRAVDRDLFRAMAALPRVCECLHMPAQSGSDRVLQAMNRGYTRAEYEERLAWGRALVPGLTFASDFLVGFPGETEAEFLETLDLVERGAFQNIFAFRYSPRPGTAAAKRKDDVPPEEKERRLQALLRAQERIALIRHASLRGTIQTVLVEGPSKRDASRMAGRTRQNDPAMFPAPSSESERASLVGREIALRITRSTALTLFGERAEE
ncbi:MAG: tRNA (N6-isopentenyl adenosine(37)-C2)-methylthiotransferase MiaB [Planctomycetota bacterium]